MIIQHWSLDVSSLCLSIHRLSWIREIYIWLILCINKVFLLVLPVRQRCTEGRFGRPRTFENRKEKSYDLKKVDRLKRLPSSMSCKLHVLFSSMASILRKFVLLLVLHYFKDLNLFRTLVDLVEETCSFQKTGPEQNAFRVKPTSFL